MNEVVMEQVSAKLSELYGSGFRIISSRAMGGGCINEAVAIDTSHGKFFVKWNSTAQDDLFLREAEGLTALKEGAGDAIKVPTVIAAKAIDDLPGFLILENLDSGNVPNQDEKLGRGLAQIHRFTAVKFGFAHNNYCGATVQYNDYNESWPVFFRDQRIGFILRLIQKERPFSGSELKVFERLMVRMEKLIPAEATPSLIHGDLWSGNYLFTSAGPALIDPAAYFADREMEFAIITMFGGFSAAFFHAYNEAFPLPADWKTRNDLYQLYHILNHYYLFGGGYGMQALRVAQQYL